MDLKKQDPKKPKDKPYILLVDDDQEALLEGAQKLLKRDGTSGNGSSSKPDEEMKSFFSSLTLIKPETEDHSFQVDDTTGIRVFHLKRGETAFPTHPTPAS